MPAAIQSALDSAGIQADRIETLWWLMFGVSAAVWIAVMIAIVMAVRRGRSEVPEIIPERSVVRSVSWAVGLTVVILIGLLVASTVTGRAIASLASGPQLQVMVTGHQWWWEVEYLHDLPSQRVRTANEIHLPVGATVSVVLKASDVIHSFWVPNLHGKMDLVPGRANYTTLRADRPGVFRGQCAEFCGLQHAHMALTVTVEPLEAFERWRAAQLQPAPDPSNQQHVRGREIVERGPCGMCHTIRGTIAGGRLGPDLTHFASRPTIAAATAPNTTANLARWIADPQQMKPGVRMPAIALSESDLQAVVAYLESLR